MSKTVNDVWEQALDAFARGESPAPQEAQPAQEEMVEVGPKQDPWFKKAKGTPQAPQGWKKFSDVFGFEPPSGNDRPGPVYKPEDFPSYMRKFIHEPDQDYALPQKETEALWHAHIDNDLVWLYGMSGTGKSSLEEQFAARIGQPFLRFNGREDVDSSAFFGQLVVEGEETVWKDGLLTEGVRHGARVLLDEATAIPPGVFMGLQWLAEKDGKLMLTDKPGSAEDRLVDPDPKFRLTFADNTRGQGDDTGNFNGTNVINTALLNRIGTTLEIRYLSRSQEIDLIKAKFGDKYQINLLDKVVELAGLLRQGQARGEISLAFSLRSIYSMLTKAWNLREHPDGKRAALQEAFMLSYGNLLPNEEESGTAVNFFNMVFS